MVEFMQDYGNIVVGVIALVSLLLVVFTLVKVSGLKRLICERKPKLKVILEKGSGDGFAVYVQNKTINTIKVSDLGFVHAKTHFNVLNKMKLNGESVKEAVIMPRSFVKLNIGVDELKSIMVKDDKALKTTKVYIIDNFGEEVSSNARTVRREINKTFEKKSFLENVQSKISK